MVLNSKWGSSLNEVYVTFIFLTKDSFRRTTCSIFIHYAFSNLSTRSKKDKQYIVQQIYKPVYGEMEQVKDTENDIDFT